MRRLRSPLKSLVALVALAAILLGTLEHEDLIFQDAGTDPFAAASEASDDVTAPQHDTGTEGLFRSEPHRHWLPARSGATPAVGRHVAAFARRPCSAPLHRPARRGFIGLVALRL